MMLNEEPIATENGLSVETEPNAADNKDDVLNAFKTEGEPSINVAAAANAELKTDSIERKNTAEAVKSSVDIQSTANFPAGSRSAEAGAIMNIRTFEPPAFISESKSYSTYKNDLYMWSRITSVPAKNQAEVVVYGLEGHPSGIKEKITVNIGDKIKDADDGIDQLVKYLDSIYKEDEMASAWGKYKNFQKVVRSEDTLVNHFIAEFEKEYMLAKTAGCEYSDTLLGFRLLEATKLTEMDEKFVLTVIDFSSAKTKQDLFEQMKASLKKFQGRTLVSTGGERARFDPALVAEVTQVLVAQGWKKPRGRIRSNTDPGERNTYKGRKNPLGADGKAKKCFGCGSEYHMLDKCDKKKDSSKNNTKVEFGMVSACVQLDDTEVTDLSNHELVMIADTVEQICLMVEEAGEQGVLDSACSKTVAGLIFINRYIIRLPEHMKNVIADGQPSKTVYQFGGGEQRISLRRIKLPAWIGKTKLTIETEIVDADIPLLIGANSLEKSKAVLDFCNMKAKFFSTEVDMVKVSTGHFCISLLPETFETPVDEPYSEEQVLHAVTNTQELAYKELQKLHHLYGHTTVEKLL